MTPADDPAVLTVEGDVSEPATGDRIVGAALRPLAALTKGGLAAATRSLAIAYASRGIRFNAVSPRIIQTPLHGVLYLESSPYITGETLHIDGGQVAGHTH